MSDELTPGEAEQAEANIVAVKLAKVCHEANRAWCEANGDLSQKHWELADMWQQQSAIRGVCVALDGATAREQHEAWSEDKRAEGWRFGTVKNPDLKEHPCLVDYDELPLEQRAKDALFGATIRALAPALGVKMRSDDADLLELAEFARVGDVPRSELESWRAEVRERANRALGRRRR